MTSGAAWTLALLHSLSYSDGQSVAGPLVFCLDGALYGSAANGGTGSGTLFAFKP